MHAVSRRQLCLYDHQVRPDALRKLQRLRSGVSFRRYVEFSALFDHGLYAISD